jgi:type II secretory pathway pseudopilin PulG
MNQLSCNMRAFQMVRHWRHLSPGQTLVEILIATAVVAVVLTAIATSLSFTVKNSAEARYRAVASSLAQEAVEVFRRERSVQGWEAFYAGLPASATYCFNTLPTSPVVFTQGTGACGTTYFSPSGTAVSFKREASLQKGANQVTITVVVSWEDTADWNDVTVTETLREI